MADQLNVSFRQGDPAETTADTRIIGLFDDEQCGIESIDKLVESGELKTSFKSTGVAHSHGARYVTAGLGKRSEFDAERARVAAAGAQARAAELGAESISWTLPDAGDANLIAGAIVEGTILKSYKFDRYKSKSGDGDETENDGFSALEVVSPSDVATAVAAASIGAHAVNRARDLQNEPANVATPSYLADRASSIAATNDHVEFEIHDREWIERKGMGAFAAVAQGATEEPRLIVIHYRHPDAKGPTLGFVGKAVTFDTGGISLKPSGKMQEMKFDMSGGAAVLEATAAIAELQLPIDLIAVVPSTENMPDANATRPGDIVTAMNGKTIEVNNTDAEGRLILADALSYAVELGAERVINLATLTGAIIIALGSTHAGHFSNDDDWYSEVLAASDTTGELGHRLPLHPEYFELTKGKYADLTNASESRKASSIYAAEFLKEFVGDTPWVHVDIAGTAWDLGRAYVGNGASGFGVRMLIELARRSAA
ncbi:MAG TPA: leucyl aminopeptidase [Solirubrobacterales bacterium]|jgi:leucyl aminopeptidase|nr:leucyl aminopeptidase [Solirubrobacterales bacterium]